MKKKTKKSNPNASDVIKAIKFQQYLERLGSMSETASVKVKQLLNDMEKRIDKNISSVFVWNLYEVGLVGRSEPILVCAPSMTGAIKRAATLVASWEDGDKYELEYVRIIGVCVN